MGIIRRVGVYVLLPVAVVLLLPVLLLVVLALYAGAMYQALRLLLLAMLGKRAPQERDMSGPHFQEARSKLRG